MDELKAARRNYIKTQPFFYRLLVTLKIQQVWFEHNPHLWGQFYRYERMNAWNPLTWVLLLVVAPIVVSIAAPIAAAGVYAHIFRELKTKKFH